MRTIKNKNKHKMDTTKAAVAIVFFIACFLFVGLEKTDAQENEKPVLKEINIEDEGLFFRISSNKNTVGDVLTEQGIKVSSEDHIFPQRDQRLYGGMTVIIHRAKKITISEGGKKETITTTCKTVEQAIWEQGNIILGEDDITKPARREGLRNGAEITVIHVQIKEEIGHESIDYKTITKEDDKLSWRTKKVTQKGEKGVREIKYKVVYHDGNEISRKVLSKETTKEPVTEEITQGTYVKVGKAHTGGASWYAYTGTLSAANPWLPMGSYVKVTNKDNGKSVIVKINDRGPFGPGRIIDLDKVAFAKIADLGQGVVNVKMEEITN